MDSQGISRALRRGTANGHIAGAVGSPLLRALTHRRDRGFALVPVSS